VLAVLKYFARTSVSTDQQPVVCSMYARLLQVLTSTVEHGTPALFQVLADVAVHCPPRFHHVVTGALNLVYDLARVSQDAVVALRQINFLQRVEPVLTLNPSITTLGDAIKRIVRPVSPPPVHTGKKKKVQE